MEHRIPEGRFTARPYVVASFGSALDESWRNRDARIWTGEAFGMPESWAFRPSSDYLRHLDAGSCSAFFNVDALDEQKSFSAYDEAGMAAVEGLAQWCVRRVLTYPVAAAGDDKRRVLISGHCYSWEVFTIRVGDIRGVVGYAVPQLVCKVASFSEVRQYVGMWVRSTFGPAFLPNDLGGWTEAVTGAADRTGFRVSSNPWDSEWRNSPRTWNAWG